MGGSVVRGGAVFRYYTVSLFVYLGKTINQKRNLFKDEEMSVTVEKMGI